MFVDTESLRVVYERYYLRVLSVLVHLVGNIEEAEEIMQDTFIKYYFAKTKPDISDESYLRAWLFRVAINGANDRFRKVKKIFSSNFLELGDEREVLKFEIRQDLQQLLAKLNEKEREVVVLKYVEEFSYEEIAAVLKISEGSLKSIASRAIKKMEEEI